MFSFIFPKASNKQAFKVKQAWVFFSLRKLVFPVFRNQFSLVPAAGPPSPVRGKHQRGQGLVGAVYNLRVFGTAVSILSKMPVFGENCLNLTWILLCSCLVFQTFNFFNPVEQWASALEFSCTPAVTAYSLTCQFFCICYFFTSAFAHIIWFTPQRNPGTWPQQHRSQRQSLLGPQCPLWSQPGKHCMPANIPDKQRAVSERCGSGSETKTNYSFQVIYRLALC